MCYICVCIFIAFHGDLMASKISIVHNFKIFEKKDTFLLQTITVASKLFLELTETFRTISLPSRSYVRQTYSPVYQGTRMEYCQEMYFVLEVRW